MINQNNKIYSTVFTFSPYTPLIAFSKQQCLFYFHNLCNYLWASSTFKSLSLFIFPMLSFSDLLSSIRTSVHSGYLFDYSSILESKTTNKFDIIVSSISKCEDTQSYTVAITSSHCLCFFPNLSFSYKGLYGAVFCASPDFKGMFSRLLYSGSSLAIFVVQPLVFYLSEFLEIRY